MRCAGIDGAGSGWLAFWEEEGVLASAYYASVTELAVALHAAAVVGVDIPIGLSEHAHRAADRQARQFVGGDAPAVSLPRRCVACCMRARRRKLLRCIGCWITTSSVALERARLRC
ncbi:DUF429 domain-containing protein [Xanthomonas vasicola]|uniref:DUF429 domain-containing protein n=1 Tax=Xanthomonas vasicola TaxID=56459 RepID=UPI001E465451|nr:DUF429 domain-containing protein [Xanthomonas vasicola]MDO6985997.1 DUF429 domain-containing protein [Xanthomonas vasicola]